MNVKHITSGKIYSAIKIGDNTYKIAGKEVSKEDFESKFEVLAEQPKPKATQSKPKAELEIVENSWQSDELGELALALSKAQGEFTVVDKSTEAYNYKYATLADTLDMVRPILSKHEIALTQLTISKMYGSTLLSGIKSMLIHSSGQWIASECYLPAEKTKSNNIAQVQGSWGSYLRRYHIMSMLNLATEDKDAQV